MFFNGWEGIWRTVIVGVLAYTALVLALRISGKRTLAKMNAFDFVVTVALGSTLATVVLSKDVALLEGITAFAVLIGLQYMIAWLSVRSDTVKNLVKSEPTLLFYQGHMLPDALRSERVAEEEVRSAIRAQGIAAIDAVQAVVLETDGTFSVMSRTDARPTALQDMSEQVPEPSTRQPASGD